MDVLRRSLLSLAAAAFCALPAAAQTSIVVASTTSTEQSGLFAHLLPAFKAATGIVEIDIGRPPPLRRQPPRRRHPAGSRQPPRLVVRAHGHRHAALSSGAENS